MFAHVRRRSRLVLGAVLAAVACSGGEELPHSRSSRAVSTPLFVQGNGADPQLTAATSVSVTYAAAQTQGNLNVVVVGWNSGTSSIASVSDTKGNAYQRAIGPTTGAGSFSQSIYYASNIASAAAGANTVTVAFSPAAPFPDVRILEYSGIAASAALDAAASGTGNSSTSSTAALTTTGANDLLVAGNYVATVTNGPGTGFTSRLISSPDGDIVEDRVVATAGSYSAAAPLGGAGGWVMQMAAFRTAGGAPDTTPPTAPGALTATAASTTEIDLSWTASTDNVGVTGYLIEGCSGAGCTFAQIGTTVGTTFNNTGLAAGTSFSYRMRATDAAGNLSAYSSTPSPTTLPPAPHPPPSPSGPAATARATQVYLPWTASTDNVGVTGYLLERCQGAGCTSFAQIATPAGASYTDSPAAAATYGYRVRATDAAGNLSGYSNTATATTAAPPAAPRFGQGNSTTPPSQLSTVTLAYTAPQQPGDLNVVIVGWNNATSAVSSVTDSSGNPYQLAIGPTTGGGFSQSIYYAANIATAATNTVTVRFNQAAPFPDLRIAEYSGIVASAPLDAVAGADGSSALSSSGNATLSSFDLIVA